MPASAPGPHERPGPGHSGEGSRRAAPAVAPTPASTLAAMVRQWQHTVGNQGLATLGAVEALAVHPSPGPTSPGPTSPGPTSPRSVPEVASSRSAPPPQPSRNPGVRATSDAVPQRIEPAPGDSTAITAAKSAVSHRPRRGGDQHEAGHPDDHDTAGIDAGPPEQTHRHGAARRGGKVRARSRPGSAPGAPRAHGDDLTTPGFTERNATRRESSPKEPPQAELGGRIAAAQVAQQAQSRRPAPTGSAPGRSSTAARPGLGDADLDRWSAAVRAAATTLGPGSSGEPRTGGSAIEQEGAALGAQRGVALVDPTPEAKAQQPAIPKEQPVEQHLDTSEADAVIAAVVHAGTRHLLDQEFSDVGAPPEYTGATLTKSDFVPKTLTDSVTRLEAELATAHDGSTFTDLTKRLAAVKERIAAIDVPGAAGRADSVPEQLTDDGPRQRAPVNAGMSDVLGDALARAKVLVPATSGAILENVLAAVHGQNVERLKTTFVADARGGLERDLRNELDAIAAAAGVSQQQLDSKVIEQELAIATMTATNEEAIDEATKSAVVRREDLAKRESELTSGAAAAVRDEVAAKRAAVEGALDTNAVDRTRDELLQKLRAGAAMSVTNLRAALEKRNGDLDSGAADKRRAVQRLAATQAAAIRRHWAEDPDKAMAEARPTADWGIAQMARVDAELRAMKELVASEQARYEREVLDQLEPGMEQIRNWAARQAGHERSDWEQTVEMLDDWSRVAGTIADAWEAHRNNESRDAAANDFNALVALKRAMVDRNRDAYVTAMHTLSAEQQQLADVYLRGGIDSIGFVAESMLTRFAARRAPELSKSFEARAIAECSWEELGQIARETNPDFQPAELANKVRRGVYGAGTRSVQLWAGLEGARTAIERAALSRCYEDTFKSTMYDDIDEDTSGAEWNRAQALMAGDAARAEAAKIAHAVAPSWLQGSFAGRLATDDDTIREALRGKSSEEIAAIEIAYAKDYDGHLLGDFRDDMSDAKYQNARALVEGDTDSADAAELEDAMSGPGTAEQKMFRVYERVREEEGRHALQHGLSKAELDQRIRDHNKRIAERYTVMGYGDLTANSTEELKDFNPANGDVDVKRFEALVGGDESEIDAAKAMGERQGLYTSDDGVERIVRNQRERAEFEVALSESAARARLVALKDANDIDLPTYVTAMTDLDSPSAEARATRERAIRDIGRSNVAALKVSYEKMANSDAFARALAADVGPETFARLVEEGTSFSSKRKIELLMSSGGKLEDYEELHFATAGLRPDNDRIADTLFGKDAEQMAKIRAAHDAVYGKGSFEAVLDSLSGREELDTRLAVQYGHPSTFVAQLSKAKPADRQNLIRGFETYLEKRRAFEKSSDLGSTVAAMGSGGWTGSVEAGGAEAGGDRKIKPYDDSGMEQIAQIQRAVEYAKAYDRALTAAEAPGRDPAKKMNDPAVVAARANFDMTFQGAMQAQTEVRDQKDAFADTVTQIAAAVVGLVATIASGGALGVPMAAMVGAIASTATSITAKIVLKGDAYTWHDIGVDVTVGVVDAAMNYAVPFVGSAIAGRLEARVTAVVAEQLAAHAGEAMSEGAVRAFVKETLMEGLTNGILAMPSAFTAGVLGGEDFEDALATAGEGGVEGAKFGMAIHTGKTAGGALIKGGGRAVKHVMGIGSQPGLGHDAVGKRLREREVSRRSNIPKEHLRRIGDVADRHGVHIDLVPMSPHAGKLLAKGRGLPRHRHLWVSEINEIDLVLGLGNETSLGKIGYFTQAQIHVPEHIDLLPKNVRDAIIARVHQRVEEYVSERMVIENYVREGKIRIDPDGVVVNTGLAGPKELPFTADIEVFDMRTRQNRQVDQERDNPRRNVRGNVMDDLRSADTGVTHDPNGDEIAATDAELRKHARELREKRYSEGGDEALVRTGGGRARAVLLEPYAVAEGTVSYFEGAAGKNEALNRANFRQHIRSEPTSEFALLRDRKTGRYMVMQGNGDEVRPRLAQQVEPDGDWEPIAHSHPVGEGGKTPAFLRIPSGGHADFAQVVEVVMAGRYAPVSSEIHFLMDDGKTIGVTRFGIEPNDPQMYFIEVPLEHGKMLTKRFRSMAEYAKWSSRELGVIPKPSKQIVLDFEQYVGRVRARGGSVEPAAPAPVRHDAAAGVGAPEQDVPSSPRGRRSTKPYPAVDEALVAGDAAPSSPRGLTADDVGKPVRGALAGVAGFTAADIAALQGVCAAHHVLIDMAPAADRSGPAQVFDIRQSDGRAIEWDVYRQVMDDLKSKVHIADGSFSHTRLDPSDGEARKRFAERRAQSEAGGHKPLVRFGGAEPKVVWHEPYEISEGSTFHLEGAKVTDRAANLRQFTDMIAMEPTAEFALMHNETTGEYLVLQGNGTNVPQHLAAAMAPGGTWVMLAHSHPIDPGSTFTGAANRLPSGSRGDFGIARDEVLRTGKAFSSEIYFTRPDGSLDVTRFGIDPTNREPYFVEVPGDRPRRFETIDQYHEWYTTEHGGDLGAVRPLHRELDAGMARLRASRQHPRPGGKPSLARVEKAGIDAAAEAPERVAANTPREPPLPPDEEHSGFHEVVPADTGVGETDVPAGERAGDPPAAEEFPEVPTKNERRRRRRQSSGEPSGAGAGGPRPDDVGKALPTAELQRRYHIEPHTTDMIRRICADQHLIIDMVPTSAEADRLLAAGEALPRPYLIQLSPLDRLDLRLGLGTEANLGKIVYFTPAELRLPTEMAELDPSLQKQLSDRLAERLDEFATGNVKLLELLKDGKIRIDEAAGNVVVNTGLAGKRQLPFTEDLQIFDIRHANNQPMSRDDYARAVLALWDANPRIKAGSFESARFDSDSVQSPDALARGREKYAKGGLVRFGEGEQVIGAARRRYALPPGSTYHFEGVDANRFVPALNHFKTLVEIDRITEVALMHNRTTGQYLIVQGDMNEVLIGLARTMAGDGDWVLLAHNHPVDRKLGYTPVTERIPSGATADMKAVTKMGTRANRRVQSLLYFTDETGKLAATRFGYDPHHAKPYFVNVPGTRDHAPIKERFETIDAYQVWMNRKIRESRPSPGAPGGASGDEQTAPGKLVPPDHGSAPGGPDTGPDRVSGVRGTDPPAAGPPGTADPADDPAADAGAQPDHEPDTQVTAPLFLDDEPAPRTRTSEPVFADDDPDEHVHIGPPPVAPAEPVAGEHTVVTAAPDFDEPTHIDLFPDRDRFVGRTAPAEFDGEQTHVGLAPGVESRGPSPDDIGRTLTPQDLAQRYGHSRRQLDNIRQIAERFRVRIEMAPTTRYAEPLVREGRALQRPPQLRIDPIDPIDVILGIGAPEHIGKIVLFEAHQVKLPKNFAQLDAPHQQELLKRGHQRRTEALLHRREVLALQEGGRIRIDDDGLIVNTGLFGSDELPFTADNEVFDIKTEDGQWLSRDRYREVMDALYEADTGVNREATSYPDTQGPDYDEVASAKKVADQAGKPLISVGEGEPKIITPQGYETPEGSTSQLIGADARNEALNRANFHEHVRRNPAREYALLHNPVTGEYLVMYGAYLSVPIEQARDMAPGGFWVLVAHNHPITPGFDFTRPFNRIPSGADADMGIATAEALYADARFESEIHWVREDGTIGITRFGMDPHDPLPYFVEVEGLPPLRFADIDEYHEYRHREFNIPIAEVPDSFRGPRSAAHTARAAQEPGTGSAPASAPPTVRASQDNGSSGPGEPDPAAPQRDWGAGDTEPHRTVRFDPDREPTEPHPIVPAIDPAPPEPAPALHPVRIGTPIGDDAVTSDWGIPRHQAMMIKAIAQHHRVLIRMGRTPAVAMRLINSFSALARPVELHLWPVEEIDVRLNLARREHLGKLVLVSPDRIVLPADFAQLDRPTQDALRGRAMLRRNEYVTNHESVEALRDAGRIRIDTEGVLVNTGLAGREELPFTLDHEVFDIVSLDGHTLSPGRYERVIDDLVHSDTGITRGRREGNGEFDAPRAEEPFAMLGDPQPDPSRRRALQLEADEQQIVDVAARPLPRADIDLPGRPDPLDGPANRQYFRDLVVALPTVELALMLNVETREYFVIKGTTESVNHALGVMKALSRMRPGGRFVLEAHSHPVTRPLGFTANIHRIPSGGSHDFYTVAMEALRTGDSYHSEIYYINEHNRLAVTHFGIDPDDPQPYYLDFARTGERPESHRFASIEAYHEWIRTEFGVDPGPVDPDFPRTPVEERALAASGQQPPSGSSGGPPGVASINDSSARPRPADAAPADAVQAERQRRRLLAIPEADVLVADRLAARTPIGDTKDTSEFNVGVRTARDAYARLPAPPALGHPGYTANPYEDGHAQRQAAANHWSLPLAAQRILCRECWQWFRSFAQEEDTTQYVADPFGVHVFGADGSYWLEPHPFRAAVTSGAR